MYIGRLDWWTDDERGSDEGGGWIDGQVENNFVIVNKLWSTFPFDDVEDANWVDDKS